MRKTLHVFLCAALCLSLAACGGKDADPGPFDPAADAQTLLDSGAFTETLEAVEAEVACPLYGIDPETVDSCAVYMGPVGASLEELAIFTLTDEESAGAALTCLNYRLEDQRESAANYAGYLQDELPKLDNAVTCQRGCSVLLVVAADYGPVTAFLEG